MWARGGVGERPRRPHETWAVCTWEQGHRKPHTHTRTHTHTHTRRQGKARQKKKKLRLSIPKPISSPQKGGRAPTAASLVFRPPAGPLLDDARFLEDEAAFLVALRVFERAHLCRGGEGGGGGGGGDVRGEGKQGGRPWAHTHPPPLFFFPLYLNARTTSPTRYCSHSKRHRTRDGGPDAKNFFLNKSVSGRGKRLRSDRESAAHAGAPALSPPSRTGPWTRASAAPCSPGMSHLPSAAGAPPAAPRAR